MRPKPLSAELFAKYGGVIDTRAEPLSINYGHTQRFHDLANLDVDAQNGRAIVSVFRSTPLSLPIKIGILERHPLSSQAFIPLSDCPYLVVVAPKGVFDETKIEVFIASAQQGVNYHRGTWHHYSLALNAESDFCVIDRGGEGKNCDEVKLENPFLISL